ncbi:MAG: hypothetical protein RR328_06685 [Bacteroidales bacterium]
MTTVKKNNTVKPAAMAAPITEVENQTTIVETPKEKKIEKDAEKLPSFIKSYAKSYPKEKVFYVSSDQQVFLEKDYSLAVLHQNSLKNEQKIQTIKIN